MFDNLKEILNDSSWLKYIFYGLIILLVALILFSFFKLIKDSLNKKKKYREMLQLSGDKVSQQIGVETDKLVKKTKKQNVIKRLISEYKYYGGNVKKLVLIVLVVYIVFVLALFLMSKNILISMLLALTWLTVVFVFVDNKNSKNRKIFIKSFSQALRTLTATIQATNDFNAGVQTIINREGINEHVRKEFTIINNDLKNNKSLGEAMEDFWKRNSSIPEFAMFAIVMQFYSKTGGAGLSNILRQLEDSLNQKVINYDKVDAELGVNKILMNIFIYGFMLALFIVPLFKTDFYPSLIDSGAMGILKVLGSVALHLLSVVLFKSMIRKCSEGV
jgi:Flp pilus assembly protein TadB